MKIGEEEKLPTEAEKARFVNKTYVFVRPDAKRRGRKKKEARKEGRERRNTTRWGWHEGLLSFGSVRGIGKGEKGGRGKAEKTVGLRSGRPAEAYEARERKSLRSRGNVKLVGSEKLRLPGVYCRTNVQSSTYHGTFDTAPWLRDSIQYSDIPKVQYEGFEPEKSGVVKK
ncbi:unnamed protein product [Calypogeia fissa]